MGNTGEKVDCYKCVHFAVTWEPAKPRACKLFGFKTSGIPSIEVLKSSGYPCGGFVKKRPRGQEL